MDLEIILKAIADGTRLKIVKILLHHNYCVRALSRIIGISEAAISQHIKVLKNAGLLVGEKKGYYMHYDVNRNVLRQLAAEIQELSLIDRTNCDQKTAGCEMPKQNICYVNSIIDRSSDVINSYCHDNQKKKGCRMDSGDY